MCAEQSQPGWLLVLVSMYLWSLFLLRFFARAESEMLLSIAGCSTVVLILLINAIHGRNDIYASQVGPLILVWTVELTAFEMSKYRRNSFNALADMVVLSLVYLACCWLRNRRAGRHSLFIGIAVFGTAIASTQIWIGAHWFQKATAAGFPDLTAIKAWCPTLIGFLLNDWATTLLLFLPFALLVALINRSTPQRRLMVATSLVCTTTILVALVLTLSRGALVGLAAFGVSFFVITRAYRIDAQRVTWLIPASGLIASAVVLLFVPSVAKATARMFIGQQTISQKRSVSGRVAVWKSALAIGRAHEGFGVGQDNFAMYLVPDAGTDPDRAFGGHAMNSPLQLFAEMGVVGVAGFGALALILLWRAHKLLRHSADSTERCITAVVTAALLAVVTRDLTYSSLLISPQASLMLWVLLACIGDRARQGHTNNGATARMKVIEGHAAHVFQYGALFVFGIGVVVCWASLRYMRAASQAASGANYCQIGQSGRGIAELALALENDPDNAYLWGIQGLAEGVAAVKAIDEEIFAGSPVRDKVTNAEMLKAAKKAYEKALQINPLDDGFTSDLGWVYVYLGNDSRAQELFSEAIKINSSNAAYHFALGTLLQRKGDIRTALEEYSQGLSLDPEFLNSFAFEKLSSTYPKETTAMLDKSIATLRAQISETGSPIQMARLGALLLKVGRNKEAVPILHTAVTELPGLWVTWRNLALALERSGQPEQAKVAQGKLLFLLTGGEHTDSESEDLQTEMADRPTEHATRVPVIYMSAPVFENDSLPPGWMEVCKQAYKVPQ